MPEVTANCGRTLEKITESGPKTQMQFKGFGVVDGMEQIPRARRIVPGRIQVDNESAFISKAFGRCTYENGVTLNFLRAVKQIDNAFIEKFQR